MANIFFLELDSVNIRLIKRVRTNILHGLKPSISAIRKVNTGRGNIDPNLSRDSGSMFLANIKKPMITNAAIETSNILLLNSFVFCSFVFSSIISPP